MIDRPLAGRRVLVTRTRERAAGLVDALHAIGCDVVVVPLIATVPLAEPDRVRAMAERIAMSEGPWAVFTSTTAVRIVARVVPLETLRRIRLAAVGPETAAALRAAGVEAALVPERHDAGALADALVAAGVGGSSVWLPAAEGGRDVLAERLGAARATVEKLVLYRSAMPADAPGRLRTALEIGVEAVTLTSGSTARHLVEALGAVRLPERVVVVCIGPQTADAARDAGLRVDAVAEQQSAEGLAKALRAALATLP